MNIGKVSGNVLKRSVLRQLKTEGKEIRNGAGIGEDCAIFSFAGHMSVCMQEAVVVLPGPKEDPPESLPGPGIAQLIQRCANNLAASGAQPVAAMLTLLLPKQLEEPALKALIAEAEDTCGQLAMAIAGGQTRVLDEITEPIAVVTGIGKRSPDADPAGYSVKRAAPGQDIVISKWIGLEGTAYVTQFDRKGLLSRYPIHLVEEAAGFKRYLSILPEAATAMMSGVCTMHDISEGGILAALWELAEGADVGLTIDLKKLPIRQETVEVCEYFNINPYQLLSGGSLLMTTEDGPGLVEALKARRIPAVIVGKVTDSNDRILMNEDEVRYLDRPAQDELYSHFW